MASDRVDVNRAPDRTMTRRAAQRGAIAFEQPNERAYVASLEGVDATIRVIPPFDFLVDFAQASVAVRAEAKS